MFEDLFRYGQVFIKHTTHGHVVVNPYKELILFKSTHDALNWAMRVKMTLIVDGPSINEMCGKARSSTDNYLLIGLTPQQAQMQANDIYGYVDNLSDPAYKDYINAKYFCAEKFDSLMQRVFSGMLHGGTTYHRGIRLLVLQYMGLKNSSRRTLKEALHCGTDRVSRHQDQVYMVMDKIHYNAMNELDKRLMDLGIIEGRDTKIA